MADITITPAVDPVTAGFQAANSLFSFLSTPAGQQLVLNLEAATGKFNSDIAAIVGHIESWFHAIRHDPKPAVGATPASPKPGLT